MGDGRDVSAVIFDLDGTLLDTLHDIAHAANIVLREAGYPEQPIDAYRYFVGNGVRILFQRALPEPHRDRVTVEACAVAFRETYSRLWNVHTRPYAGVEELLRLIIAMPLSMAVLSNKPHAFTERCVAEYLPQEDFRVVLGQRDGVPQKPDPTGALEIAAQLALPPGRIVFVGDTAVDMQTAIAAGMVPIGVRWGFRPERELIEAGAQSVLGEPGELLELLSGQ
jgi:phosphoglycolate phosphatase